MVWVWKGKDRMAPAPPSHPCFISTRKSPVLSGALACVCACVNIGLFCHIALKKEVCLKLTLRLEVLNSVFQSFLWRTLGKSLTFPYFTFLLLNVEWIHVLSLPGMKFCPFLDIWVKYPKETASHRNIAPKSSTFTSLLINFLICTTFLLLYFTFELRFPRSFQGVHSRFQGNQAAQEGPGM